MKATVFLFTLFALPTAVPAGPVDDFRHNQRARRVAIDHFRAGSSANALSHLRQNLRPEPGAGGDQTALPQNLIEIASDFYNHRELRLAREAALHAHQAAEPVLAGRSAATVHRRAQLYASLGLLYESVLFDLTNALACYDAALALHPTDPLSLDRRAATVGKLQRRNGGAR
jgi:hypothetical protein